MSTPAKLPTLALIQSSIGSLMLGLAAYGYFVAGNAPPPWSALAETDVVIALAVGGGLLEVVGSLSFLSWARARHAASTERP